MKDPPIYDNINLYHKHVFHIRRQGDCFPLSTRYQEHQALQEFLYVLLSYLSRLCASCFLLQGCVIGIISIVKNKQINFLKLVFSKNKQTVWVPKRQHRDLFILQNSAISSHFLYCGYSLNKRPSLFFLIFYYSTQFSS